MDKKRMAAKLERAYDNLTDALKLMEALGPSNLRGDVAHAKDIIGETLDELRKDT